MVVALILSRNRLLVPRAVPLHASMQDPHTRLSALYQIVNALVIMIVVSAYTANLAAFLTIAQTPTVSFSSVADLVAQNKAACSVGTYAAQRTMDSLYPDLTFDTSRETPDTVAEGLLDESCQAAIVPKVDYDTWRTDGSNCQLSLVGGSVYFSTAGWVTNLNSTWCVQRPIELAIHELQAEGVIDDLMDRWLPHAACITNQAPVDTERARRLGESGSYKRSAASRSRPTRGRRRLKGSRAGEMAAAAAEPAEEDDGLQVITPKNFFGIFFMWGCATVAILFLKALVTAYQIATKKIATMKTHHVSDSTSDGSNHGPTGIPRQAAKGKELQMVYDEHLDQMRPQYPAGLDINSNGAMMRYLIVSSLHPTVPVHCHKYACMHRNRRISLTDGCTRVLRVS